MEEHHSVSDDTKVAIPLRNLLSILGAVAISTWAYYGVIERLNVIETAGVSMLEEIEENDTWIDNFEPPSDVQDTINRVRNMEIKIAVLEEKIRSLTQRIK